MKKEIEEKWNPTSKTVYSERESLKTCLFKAIWQACVIASIKEWPLLLLGLGSTLTFTAPRYWSEIREWWFDIKNWLIAIFLTFLYTMIRHNVELNSFVFFAKRSIIISLTALSLNYLLNDEESEKPRTKAEVYSELKRKIVYITSQICISLLMIAPFIKNIGTGSGQFDDFLGLQGASQIIALILMITSASLPLTRQANQRNLAMYCLFTTTSTLIFTGAQSRMTAGVMMTSIIYMFGYVHKKKLLKILGETLTRLWIIYYAIFLPLCTIAAPIIHDKAKWMAKILYTATGSRYTLAWSANLWHENGLNFLNNDKSSSIITFLSRAYFDPDFTSLYGGGSDPNIFLLDGAHSIYISILLKSQSLTFSLAITWAVLTLSIVLLFREYKSKVNSRNLSSNTTTSLEIFMALILSVLAAESVSISLTILSLATYALLLENSPTSAGKWPKDDIKQKTILNYSARDNILSLTSPVIMVMPLILYGLACILARLGFFANIFKLQ